MLIPKYCDRAQRIETTIEQLIALLDHVDGDADREPSLCGLTFGAGNGIVDHFGAWEQGHAVY